MSASETATPAGHTEIGRVVMSTIREVAAEHGQILPLLEPELLLVESGLDSLCLAVIVARLEDLLGIDPLSQSEETALPVTLGEFVRLYESAGR